MILSNKLNIDINYKNIDNDFDIFCISKNEGNYFESNILDKISTDFKAKSVVYMYGNKWFVMFDKHKVDFDSIKRVIAIEDSNSIINRVNIYDRNDMKEYILAQLLFNTLKTPRTKELAFSNVSGNLYYIRSAYMKDMPKSFYTVQIKLNYKHCLELKVKTFSSIDNFNNEKNKKQYVFDKDLEVFRRKLKTDNFDKSKIYIEKSSNGKRNTLDFLDFRSYDKFCDSRSGIYAEFMKNVKEYLNDYIKVEFSQSDDYKSYQDEDSDFESIDYKKLLENKGFYIVDDVSNDASKDLLERLKYELINFYGVTNFYDEYREDLYVIRIIHNKEYYKDMNIDDVYNRNEYKILQHITLEDFNVGKKEKQSPSIKKIVQELLIKDNIENNKVSIVNWNYNKTINFVYAEYVKGNNKILCCYRMTINTDGTFVIEKKYSDIYTGDKEWEKIFEIYNNNNKDEIEGLVYYDYSNINIIRKTNQCTLPNVIRLAENLYLSDKHKEIKVSNLLEAIDEFKIQNEYEDIDYLYNELKNYPLEYIQIGEVLKILSIRKKAMQELNDYLRDTKGILLHPTPKAKEFKNIYFAGVLDIKYFYKDNKLYYFVGLKNKNLNLSIPNACTIREVESTTENIFFEEMLELLAVDFVKNGFYTVIPFPFKYLREFIAKTN